MQVVIIIIYVLCAVSGVVCFKLGANEAFNVALSSSLLSKLACHSWIGTLFMQFYSIYVSDLQESTELFDTSSYRHTLRSYFLVIGDHI